MKPARPDGSSALLIGEEGDAGHGLNESLLADGAEQSMLAKDADADRRSLIVSVLTLALSIPALIGA